MAGTATLLARVRRKGSDLLYAWLGAVRRFAGQARPSHGVGAVWNQARRQATTCRQTEGQWRKAVLLASG
jgi:hypothetical protein